MTTNQVLRQFITKMDRLWKQYDQAVDKIPREDALAYKRYSEHLDKFFVCYWHIFNDAVDSTTVDELLRKADDQYDESVRKLEDTWHNTTDALLRKAIELKEISEARTLPQLLPQFHRAERLLKEGRKDDTIRKRIDTHMEVADLLEEFVGKLESAK
jgi:hypothetical protein